MKLRFAARAQGLLHVGEARLGLVNYLLARRHGGRFFLRLDDLAEEGREASATAVEHDLAWLGLGWDAVIRQSVRREAYDAAAERLRASGRLYACFESEEELRAKQERRRKRGQVTIYDRAMLALTPAQRARAEAGGKRPYWRFRLSGAVAEWADMALGRQAVKLSAVSDPVLVRADGTPLQLFASVVDDLAMGVTHVARGAEAVTATGIELDLAAALGARAGATRFAHLPGLEGLERGRGPNLRGLRADGVEPQALAGYLAWLGTGGEMTPATAGALAKGYDLSRVGHEPPAFEAEALLRLNRQALSKLPFAAAQGRLPEGATEPFWLAVRGGLDLLREARAWLDVTQPGFVAPVMSGEEGLLRAALRTLPEAQWDAATWGAWTAATASAQGLSAAPVRHILRLALTGEAEGPEMDGVLPLIGPAETARRLKQGAAAAP